jgi:ligand-binding sensor domain-containing protein
MRLLRKAVSRPGPWPWVRRLITLAFLLAFAGIAAAHPETATSPDYRLIVRQYGPESGFSQNEVNALVQGPDGYLWLGTFGGLVRFDGDGFTTLRAVRGNASRQPDATGRGGPSSDRISVLRLDEDGRLWIGTAEAGLNLYDNGRFQHFPICGGTCEVFAISAPAARILWVATSAGVFRIRTDTLLVTPVVDNAAGAYTEVAVGKDGHAYLSGWDRRMGKVVGDAIVPVPLPQGVGSTRRMIEVGGYLWVTTDQGLYGFDPVQGAWAPKVVEKDALLLDSPDGQLWVSTKSGKLLRAGASGEFETFPGLPTMPVNAVSRDRDGVLWIGSVEKGLWSMQASKAMLRDNVEDRLMYGGAGRAVTGDGKGGVWLGFGCGGLRHRLEDGSHEHLRAGLMQKNECIVTLLRDVDGALWAGTASAGLLRMTEGRVETIPSSSNFRNLQIWQSDSGEYWLAADGHTFKVRRDGNDSFSLSQPVAALEGHTIRRMVAARKGGVWFVGDQGAIRLEGGRVVERWTPEQGLSSRFARSLHEDDSGVLWIGTYGGGLNRIEGGVVTRYDESNGLFDDTVSCILADRQGRMWLGGNRGISVLPKASQQGGALETIPFAVSSGSVSFELNGGTHSACYQDQEGHLWFALVKGFAEIDPGRFAGTSVRPPDVHIERVTSAGSTHDPDGTIVLGAADELLEIEYTAINLTNPDQLTFRYRMSGVDSRWIDTGSTRSIIFQDVPWGENLFEVQAKNRGGNWSPSAKLAISRPVPWYQHQWLWPLVGLLALLTVMWRTRESSLPLRHSEHVSRIAGARRRG